MTQHIRPTRITNSGQSLLETIMALGIILIAVTATIGLLISTMKTGKTSTNRIIAANLAREGIEAARQIRDSNWLRIQANEDVDSGTADIQLPGTFDGLFGESSAAGVYHHVRYPVLNNFLNTYQYYCPIGSPIRRCYRSSIALCFYRDASDMNYWTMEDIDGESNCATDISGNPATGQTCFRNYRKLPLPGAYDQVIAYAGKNTMCTYEYDNEEVTYPCGQVFENHDVFFGGGENNNGVGFGYFNQLPESGYLKDGTPDSNNPIVDHNFTFYRGDCSVRGYNDPSEPLIPTTPTPFNRWMVFDPICRVDDGTGIPVVNPNDPNNEKVITTDGQTCPANNLLVGLRVQSHVAWSDGTGPHEVVLEDRLYNWKYVK